ncbi:hypothetical protein CEXT_214711 [Caerostris extrusa]|uniref:Uncharacterized protein n=1 Tax=Caerostris extrusa TaxID=172846 RepID=A0AAV4PGK3_CAEEX|nr:hypothetical protein CEXT_214711 [Caerostris extrusa]
MATEAPGLCFRDSCTFFPLRMDQVPFCREGWTTGGNGWRAYLIGTIRQEGGDGVQPFTSIHSPGDE